MQQASGQDALTSNASATRESAYSGRSVNSAWDLSYPAPLTVGPGSVALPGEIKKAKSAPGNKSKPMLVMGHARQQSSVSTYVVGGEEDEVVDLEKFPVPVVVTERRVSDVGLAF